MANQDALFPSPRSHLAGPVQVHLRHSGGVRAVRLHLLPGQGDLAGAEGQVQEAGGRQARQPV